MYSRKLYFLLFGSIVLIVLFALLGAFLLINDISYTLSFGCLIVILLISLFVIRLTNRFNHKIATFFTAIQCRDYSQFYPEEQTDRSLSSLYSDMNRITKQLNDSQTEVEEKRLYYEGVIRVLTHEMRNSIAPIASLSADLLKHPETYQAEEVSEGLAVINNQAKSLTAFLDSYHRLTHLPEPVLQVVPIKPLFQKLKRLLCAEPESERIQYVFSSADLSLSADPNLLVLALINLIRNALQSIAGQPDGKVTIEAFEGAKQRYIIIADNGPGIPAERLSAIFTPFYSTKPGGSGIGLSLSFRIMRLHNGTLSVTSQPGERTVFRMEFCPV
ncbi:MAG: HAMP domain-containing sensor histidine kinase [Tannerellaceae bacterium]